MERGRFRVKQYDYTADRRLALGRRRRDQVAEHFGMRPKELVGDSRVASIAHARYTAAWMLRREDQFLLREIGELLGGRDHSTVLNAIRQIDMLLQWGDQPTAVTVLQLSENPLPCIHIWVIGSPDPEVPKTPGRCRLCGDEREFRKTIRGSPQPGTARAKKEALASERFAADVHYDES